METSIAALVAILDEEISVYQELLQLAEAKRKLIGIVDKLAEFEELTKREAQLAQAIIAAEDKRMQIMDELASQLGSHLAAATLAEVAGAVDGPEREQLLARRQTLSELLAELKNETTLTRKLLDRELRFINYSLSLVTGEGENKQGYSELGSKQKSATGRSLLDWKA